MTSSGLYRLKPASQRLLRPIEHALVARHVRADTLTLAAIPVAAVGGLALALSDGGPALLIVVPIAAAVRLVLNLLDGQVARRSGTSHAVGEVANELGDRVGDVLFLGGLAFVGAVGPLLAGAAVVAALLASYAGLASRAAGGPRQYGGVMSKPGRMATVSVAASAALVSGDARWLAVGATVILAGCAVTLGQRIRSTIGDLGDA